MAMASNTASRGALSETTQEQPDHNKCPKNVRTGHLSRLSRLLKEIEDAMSNYNNMDKVYQLQIDIATTLSKFISASDQYTKTLSDPEEINKERILVANRIDGKKALDDHIDIWALSAPNGQRRQTQSVHSSSTSRSSLRRAMLKTQKAEHNLAKLQRLQTEEDERRKRDNASKIAAAQDAVREAMFEEEEARIELEENMNVQCENTIPKSVSFRDPIQSVAWTQRYVNVSQDTNHDGNLAPLPPSRATVSAAGMFSSTVPTVPSYTATRPLPHVPIPGSYPLPNGQISDNVNYYTQNMSTPANNQQFSFDNFTLRNTTYEPYAARDNIPYTPPAFSCAPAIQNQSNVSNTSILQQCGFDPVKNEGNTGFQHRREELSSSTRNTEMMVEALRDMAAAIRVDSEVPRVGSFKFNGDPCEYVNFMNRFETNISKKLSSNSSRLRQLVELCTGKARECIAHCTTFPNPTKGFYEAMSILKTNFGQSHVISEKFRERLLKGPPIKPDDHDGLLMLANNMRQCKVSLEQIGYSSEINNSETLLRIMWRLPFFLQNKWVVAANDVAVNQYRDPNFSDFTEFVVNQANLANTFYGRNVRRPRTIDQNRQGPRQRNQPPTHFTTLATSQGPATKRNPAACICCEANDHAIGECVQFCSFDLPTRKQFAFDRRLCFNCLCMGHFAKDCRSKANCTHRACFKRHHTLFHDDFNDTPNTQAFSGQTHAINSSSDCSPEEPSEERTCYQTGAGNRTCLHVLPVRIAANGKEITTHALLDTGSDITLCTNKVIRDLGIDGKRVSFNLNTVSAPTKVSHGVEVSLNVLSIDKTRNIHIPRVWSLKAIPINSRNIPRTRDIRAWGHLREIEIHEIRNAEVGLLIGGDVPEAFWVTDLKLGGAKEPIGVKTPLGWSVIGPLDRTTPSKGNVNLISRGDTLLSSQVKEFWDTEFKDVHCLENFELSKNDLTAMKIIEQSLRRVDGHYEFGLPWKDSPDQLSGNLSMAKSRLASLKGAS